MKLHELSPVPGSNPKAYRKAVALLAESEFIDIFGVENSLTPAMDLFTKLGYLGLTCRLNTDAYLQQIGAGHLPHGAVAVASPIRAVRRIRSKRCDWRNRMARKPSP